MLQHLFVISNNAINFVSSVKDCMTQNGASHKKLPVFLSQSW
jgi:hypothetical protein